MDNSDFLNFLSAVISALLTMIGTVLAAYLSKRGEKKPDQNSGGVITLPDYKPPPSSKTKRGKWLLFILLALVILTIVIRMIFSFTTLASMPIPTMAYQTETSAPSIILITPSTYPSVPTPMGRFHQIQLDVKIKSGTPQVSYQVLYYVDNDRDTKKLLAHAVSPRDGLVTAISAKFLQAITIQIEPVDGTVWQINMMLDGKPKSADTVNGEITFQVP